MSSPSSPNLKRVMAVADPALLINNYMYQLTRPEGCISKQEAMQAYKLKKSDFITLKPNKTVPNPHCPSKPAYWFHPEDIANYLISKNSSLSDTAEDPGILDNEFKLRKSPKKAKKPTIASSSSAPANSVGRKRTIESAATRGGPGGSVQVPRECELGEGGSPNKKRKVSSFAYFEILDDGSTRDLPLEKD